MSHVYHDDSWKNQRIEKRKSVTRAEEQERINKEYMWGEMERDEWSRLTDELSSPLKWAAAGRVKHTPLKDMKQP